MIRHGSAPFLECSSRGDKRFSAFSARIQRRGGRSIEEIYQAAKVFEDGSTGLSWRAAKGRKAVNQEECAKLYAVLWDEYIAENPALLAVLRGASGLSDVFGQRGHCCQATELWRIRGADCVDAAPTCPKCGGRTEWSLTAFGARWDCLVCKIYAWGRNGTFRSAAGHALARLRPHERAVIG